MSDTPRTDAEPLARFCPRSKCGEFNVMKCCRPEGHDGECCFVVDKDNDYPWNKARKIKGKDCLTPKLGAAMLAARNANR